MDTRGGLIGAACGLMMALLATGCVTRVVDLADTPPYKDQIGSCYELAEDSYLVTIREIDELFIVNRCSSFSLPEPVDAGFIGKSTGELNIKGVIPRGTRMKVAAIRATNSYAAGRNVDYFLEIGDGVDGARLRLDAYYVQMRKGWDYFLDERSFRRLDPPSPSMGAGRGEGVQAGGGKPEKR